MIIELYIIIQVLAFLLYLFCWYSRNVLMWGLSVIIFGIQIFNSFNIQYLITIVESLTSFVTETITVSSLTMVWINVLMFSLSLMLFFYDIFNPKNETMGLD